MAQALSNDLRRRVVAAVMEGGMSRRGAARRYGIAPSTAIKWVDAWQRTGSYRSGRQGGDRRSQRIEARAAAVLALIEETPDMTLAEIAAHLEDAHGLRVSQSTVWRFFHRRGVTFKKNRACQRAAAPGRAATPTGLVRGPPRPRPRQAGLRRRDRGVDQDGQAMRPGCARTALPRAGAARALEDHHLRRRLAPRRHDRPHGARRRHAWRRLPGLCRAGAGSSRCWCPRSAPATSW